MKEQDWTMVESLWANVVSWFISTFAPSLLNRLITRSPEEDEPNSTEDQTRCIPIGRPGGLEQLRLVYLKNGFVTLGYNCAEALASSSSSATTRAFFSVKENGIPSDSVVLKNQAFSINYADCTIRWGLYESAKRFVGWPIVPGFDIAGTIEQVSNDNNSAEPKGAAAAAGEEKKTDSMIDLRRRWNVGDRVFGCTLFGSYSSRILVPSIQLRPIPKGLSTAQAAAIPAVSLTALYALSLAGYYFPGQKKTKGLLLYPPPHSQYKTNNAILIHSAAGGVGSMLVQMSRLLGLSPIVGVVGRSTKVEEAKRLGCDVVIDKSSTPLYWDEIAKASPRGYAAIMDANGASTMQQSYDHLAPTGRLIVFGYHSNLPMSGGGMLLLSPFEWIKMAYKMLTQMPKFDAMDMTVENKSVMSFNLSFFADEKILVSTMLDQVCEWFEEGELVCPRVTEMDMERIAEAHDLIQSGKSVGKIVMTV